MTPGYIEILRAQDRDRRNLFQIAAQRMGTAAINIEKDFWVCLTLEALFNWPMKGGARLLFKGGTSLSKAWGLISRFSEDIDISISRDDLGAPGEADELEKLSANQRKKRLEAMTDAAARYIAGRLLPHLRDEVLQSTFERADRGGAAWTVQVDPAENQTLLFAYPSVLDADDGYVRREVKIEMGARTAFAPHQAVTIKPFILEDVSGLPLDVASVVTVMPTRTFWDKAFILHELRARFEEQGRLPAGGQRLTRHYYDLHRLIASPVGADALANLELGNACLAHRRVFFPGRWNETAAPGGYRLVPSEGMVGILSEDYQRMTGMIFGDPPNFADVMASIAEIEERLNGDAG